MVQTLTTSMKKMKLSEAYIIALLTAAIGLALWRGGTDSDIKHLTEGFNEMKILITDVQEDVKTMKQAQSADSAILSRVEEQVKFTNGKVRDQGERLAGLESVLALHKVFHLEDPG